MVKAMGVSNHPKALRVIYIANQNYSEYTYKSKANESVLRKHF